MSKQKNTQNKLKDDSKIIEDSLLALSKRAPQISAIVNREINSIHMNMDKTVKALADRNTGEGTMRMQSSMTSINNLALLLNESLEQMRKEMEAKKVDVKYDRTCLKLSEKEIQEKVEQKIQHVVRMKIPENRTIKFHDIVRGEVEFQSNLIDDQVLLKSDGFPTYHLAVVVGDQGGQGIGCIKD